MTGKLRPARRVDLDRWRVLACLSTFGYHSIQVFDLNPYYHVKSNTLSPTIDVAARLLHAVRMPLFFMIAGMVGFLALRRYSNREFIRQRAARLLVPFLFGIVLITPAVKYLELLDGRSIDWTGVIRLGLAPPDTVIFLRRYFTQLRWFSWSHLWFPLYLFVLGVALLPAMRSMATWQRSGQRSARYPIAVLLGLPFAALVAIELGLRPFFPHHVPNLIGDWASMAVYTVALLSGAALVRWPEFEIALRRWLPATAAIAVVGAAVYIGTTQWPLPGIGRALTLWGALAVMIGLGPLLERGTITAERYFADAVLPIYVLHHVPLLLFATAVKDMPWPIWQRYWIIVLGSFTVTLTLYHFLVRPFGPVRVAFGQPRRAGPAA